MLSLLITVFLLIFLFIYILGHLEKLEKGISIFYKIINYLFKVAKRKRIAYEIQTRINDPVLVINSEFSHLLPYSVKISWIKEMTPEAFLENNKVVVRLDYHPNQGRNLVVATLKYLATGLLPRARPYVDNVLMKGIDFTLAKRIFQSCREFDATTYFLNEIFSTTAKEIPKVDEYCKKLETIAYDGLFTRVFLREIYNYGESLFPAVPTSEHHAEAVAFLNYLHGIAEKKKNENVELDFSGQKMRLYIILFTKEATVDFYGIEPYLNRIDIGIANGIETIYLFGILRRNISMMEKVVEIAVKQKKVRVIKIDKYEQFIWGGKKLPAICIICSTRLERKTDIILGTEKYLLDMINKVVPEVEEGKIEIVGIAREPGVLSKICVKGKDPTISARACMIGPQGERIRGLIALIEGEWVDIVEWNDNINDFILNALHLHHDIKNPEVLTDHEKNYAIVAVPKEFLGLTIGKNGINVKLAGKITGWRIDVVEAGTPLDQFPKG